MEERTLAQWLAHQASVHPQSIDLGLERIGRVAAALGLGRPARQVVTVAGTNGKGSTVAFVEAIARAAGLRTGAYTSPHLWRYNERVRIDGVDAADDALVAAFAAIEVARDGVPLTFFEYGTLAALRLFEAADLDLAVLEVGLGGRLDATNLVDADVAVITTVDLDHQDWLGADREAIGAEKAGILRAGRPCVLGERDPPSSVLRRAYAIGAPAIRADGDYQIDDLGDGAGGWRWREPGWSIELPAPGLPAAVQRRNAAAAIAALRALELPLPGGVVPDAAIVAGVRGARAPARLQRLPGGPGQPETVLDVAHNPQAARELAAWLAANPKPTVAVFAALSDKDVAGIVGPLAAAVDAWFTGPIVDAGPRGLPAEAMRDALQAALRAAGVVAAVDALPTLAAARAAAVAAAAPHGRVLVFGSFHTVAEAMAAG